MGGIQGRLNKQFARDDRHLGADLGLQRVDPFAGAFRAPAQAAERIEGILGRFFGGFNRGFAKATHGYVNWSHALIRKAGLALLILAGFAVADGLIGRKLPASFLPEEDYGYAFLNVQLPAGGFAGENGSGVEKSRGDSRPDRGGAVLRHDWRLQPADSHFSELPGLLLRLSQALGRARSRSSLRREPLSIA